MCAVREVGGAGGGGAHLVVDECLGHVSPGSGRTSQQQVDEQNHHHSCGDSNTTNTTYYTATHHTHTNTHTHTHTPDEPLSRHTPI